MNESSRPPSVTAEASREYLPPTPEQKAQWVKQFLESGLSIRKFSAQHKVPRMSLWRWVNASPEVTAADTTSANSATREFAELKLPTTFNRSDWAVELTLPNGTIMRLSKDVPSAVVDQLLRLC